MRSVRLLALLGSHNRATVPGKLKLFNTPRRISQTYQAILFISSSNFKYSRNTLQAHLFRYVHR
jgi:hypothetical protein